MQTSIHLKFWGTRGSATPHNAGSAFGIHTTCVEVAGPTGVPLFVDMGSGIVPAVNDAVNRGVREINILMTHLHSDHLAGVFGCCAFYRADCKVTIYSTRHDTKAAFHTLFASPFHPVPFDKLAAAVNFIELSKKGILTMPELGLTITWIQVPHPQGCAAYRIDNGRDALVFATDIELGKTERINDMQALLSTPYPAGLAVFDGFYSPDEIGKFENWGHSSWKQALVLTSEAGVGTLLMTHHHPARSDEQLELLAATGRPAIWAREGQTWIISNNKATQLVS